MWGFNKNITLKDSGFLKGITDFHSHILPGVDDGIKNIEDSITVLEQLELLGVKKIWLTPHIMEDYPNETKDLEEIFSILNQKWTGQIKLALGSENMLDSLFEKRLEKNDFLPMGDDRKSLLVETSFFNPPLGMKEMIRNANDLGYDIILAHPERYSYMEAHDYFDLKKEGITFQLNYMSFAGAYGDRVKKKAEWLLENDFVDLFGSDIHRTQNLDLIFNGKIKSKISNMMKKSSQI